MLGVNIVEKEYENYEMHLDKLMDKYGNSILRLCYMYLNDYSLAEDAVQDTFINVYKSRNTFRNECNEKTWITKIAINVCKSYMRKSWFKRIFTTDDIKEEGYHYNFNTNIDRENIVNEIMKLPQKYKEVILLYYYYELKIPEISQVLGIPSGTASIRLKRGRERLKETLEDWYYE